MTPMGIVAMVGFFVSSYVIIAFTFFDPYGLVTILNYLNSLQILKPFIYKINFFFIEKTWRIIKKFASQTKWSSFTILFRWINIEITIKKKHRMKK